MRWTLQRYAHVQYSILSSQSELELVQNIVVTCMQARKIRRCGRKHT